MARRLTRLAAVAAFGALAAQPASAALINTQIFTGNVGLSVDAVGSNNSPVGALLAEVPVSATVLRAFLYSAGTPFPFFQDSPTSLGDYNGAGIVLDGTAVDNFDHLVGAVSTPRPDIGAWYTGRADVTGIVNAYRTANPGVSNLSLGYDEGALNNFIDGGVLVVVYNDAALPDASVVLLDGGQDTGGETTTVNFGAPLPDVSDPAFAADMSLAISFSCCGQVSNVDVNGVRLTSSAGNPDDGGSVDGSLITAGGVGDSNANPAFPLLIEPSDDDELYDLRPFLAAGDTSFSIFTNNETADDNIFFLGLYITAEVSGVVTPGTPGVPEPAAIGLLGLGLAGATLLRRRRTA